MSGRTALTFLIIASMLFQPTASASFMTRFRLKQCIVQELENLAVAEATTTSERQEQRRVVEWFMNRETGMNWQLDQDTGEGIIQLVVPLGESDQFIGELHHAYGDRLKARDAVADGMENVNRSYYTDAYELPSDRFGHERSLKGRFRQYGSRPAGSSSPPRLSKGFRKRINAETKISHPEKAMVVRKPGITMYAGDAEYLRSVLDAEIPIPQAELEQVVFPKLEQLRKRTLDMTNSRNFVVNNPNKVASKFKFWKMVLEERARVGYIPEPKPGVVNKLRQVMEKPDVLSVKPKSLRIEYSRKAHKMLVQDLSGARPIDIEVQITVDRNPAYFRLDQSKRPLKAYGKDVRIVELKVPVEYAEKPPEWLEKNAPELYHIMSRYSELHQVSGMLAGKGKRSILESEMFKDLTLSEKVSQFLRKRAVVQAADYLVKQSGDLLVILLPAMLYGYFDWGSEDSSSYWETQKQGLLSVRKRLLTIADHLEKDPNAPVDSAALTQYFSSYLELSSQIAESPLGSDLSRYDPRLAQAADDMRKSAGRALGQARRNLVLARKESDEVQAARADEYASALASYVILMTVARPRQPVSITEELSKVKDPAVFRSSLIKNARKTADQLNNFVIAADAGGKAGWKPGSR